MQDQWLLKPTKETFDLGVLEQTRDDGKRFVLYHLPDAVMIIPLSKDGTIIRIQELGNRPQKLGQAYHNMPGETLEASEDLHLKSLYEALKSGEQDKAKEGIKSFVCSVAARGLKEELGHIAANLEYLGNILESTGRSKRLIHFVLAERCERVRENEVGISSSTITPKEFWESMKKYLATNPTDPHGGANTLKAFIFAANRLNWWPQII